MKKETSPDSSALLLAPKVMKKNGIKSSVLYIDEEEEDDSLLYDKMSTRRSTSLLCLDSLIIIVEILQFLALIHSMALRWAWPETFISATSFLFLFNIDIWEFVKLLTPAAYKHIQGHHVSSSLIPINYSYLLIGWMVLLVILIGVFVLVYVYLRHQKHPYMRVRIARLQQVYVVLVQLIALPLGVVGGRVFQCSDMNTMDIDNSVTCLSQGHWGLMAPTIVCLVLIFILFPAWLIHKIRQEIYVLWISKKKHEAFLQLKELEYRQGLNLLWVLKSYNIFASFSRGGIYYRPFIHMVKLSLVLVFALCHHDIWLQAGLSLALFSIWFLVLIICRPFRVTVCNCLVIYAYAIQLGICLYGTVMASASPTLVGSPWMLYPYNVWILGVLYGLLAMGIVVYICYCLTREIICYKRCCKEHLWPTLTRHGLSRLSPHTRKYMKALLKGTIFLENIQKIPPMFARADQLANQIEVTNIYCREAEYLEDVMHRPLLELLDSMILTHNNIFHKSLFSNTIKSSIQETASTFMEMLPMFSRRLTQREYDFILLPPLKKRILLKMLCLAVFLNGRKEKVAKKKLVEKSHVRLWQQRPEIREFEEPDYYFEDMYPSPLQEPACRPDSSLSDSEDDLQDGVIGQEMFQGGHLQLNFTSSSDSALDEVRETLPVDDEELPGYSLVDLRHEDLAADRVSISSPLQGHPNPGFLEEDTRTDNSPHREDNSVILPEQVPQYEDTYHDVTPSSKKGKGKKK